MLFFLFMKKLSESHHETIDLGNVIGMNFIFVDLIDV